MFSILDFMVCKVFDATCWQVWRASNIGYISHTLLWNMTSK